MSESKRDWFKSSHSGSGNCVEVRWGTDVRIRNSKDPGGGELTTTLAEWTSFLRAVADGEFDLTDHSFGSSTG